MGRGVGRMVDDTLAECVIGASAAESIRCCRRSSTAGFKGPARVGSTSSCAWATESLIAVPVSYSSRRMRDRGLSEPLPNVPKVDVLLERGTSTIRPAPKAETSAALSCPLLASLSWAAVFCLSGDACITRIPSILLASTHAPPHDTHILRPSALPSFLLGYPTSGTPAQPP